MFRYIVLSWNPEDHEASEFSRVSRQRLNRDDWTCAVSENGLVLLYEKSLSDTNSAQVLADGRSVLLGTIFRSAVLPDGSYAKAAVGGINVNELDQTGGRSLINDYWGRYVLVHRSGGLIGRTHVLRDPSGQFPCYTTAAHRVRFFYSHAEDMIALNLCDFDVNWRYVSAFSCLSVYRGLETGISQIEEIQPGEYVRVDAGGTLTRSFCWTPAHSIRNLQFEHAEAATQQIRTVTMGCIASWASSHPRLIHLLSGGLDSSVVLACLTRASSQPSITCLTHCSREADDELALAREVANAARCGLIEHSVDNAAVSLEPVHQISRFPVPWSYQYAIRNEAFEFNLAREIGATALFSGAGGDHIFFQSPLVLAAVDYAFRHGIDVRLFSIAMQVAQAEGRSYWTVLRDLFKNRWLRSAWTPFDEVPRSLSLVSSEVLEQVHADRSLIHPWLLEVDSSHGKLWHAWYILNLCNAQGFYAAMGSKDHPERIDPLASQPLIELCLSIPLYVHAQGGWDRSLERRAFRDNLPRNVVMRRRKGYITRAIDRLLEHNLSFVREMILDGLLIQQGILDKDRVEKALQPGSTDRTRASIVAFHLSTEAWARKWTSSRSMRKAA